MSKTVHQRKQAKLKRLQDPGPINAGDLNKEVQIVDILGGRDEGIFGRQKRAWNNGHKYIEEGLQACK